MEYQIPIKFVFYYEDVANVVNESLSSFQSYSAFGCKMFWVVDENKLAKMCFFILILKHLLFPILIIFLS